MPARLLWCVVGLLGWAAVAAAQGGDTGLLVRVEANLDTKQVDQIKERVNTALASGADRPSKVIFWFTPKDQPTASASYGACAELADAIQRWRDVNTVAFVSAKLSGHAVLPALCCNELAMSKEASIGEVVPAGAEPLEGLPVRGYETLLRDTKPAHFAVVRKMYDKTVRLMIGQKNKADWYYDSLDKAKFEKEGGTATNTTPVPGGEAGVVGLFSSERMGQFGLRKLSAQSVSDLAVLLNVAPGSLREDPNIGKAPKAFRYVLRDAVSQQSAETLVRTVKQEAGRGYNLLFLQLECDEGDASAARDLAGELIKLQEGEKAVRVVAFIPNNANNTSVLVALGCSEIVMSTRKGMGEGTQEGTLGDFEPYMKKNAVQPKVLSDMLADLAEKQNLPANLFRGMVDKDLELVLVRGAKDRRRTAIMPKSQAVAEKAEWNEEGSVKKKGELLKLTASEAKKYGLVSTVIDGTSLSDVYPRYGVDKADDATPDLISQFRTLLQNPIITTILVILGFIGLILELKVPGVVVPGIIAALAFILLFWAWAPVSGLAWLAGLLFVFGLILIILEVFVFPGFGVPGVVGILAMLSAIVLITMERFPEDGAAWFEVAKRTAVYIFALIGAAVGAFLIARFLPKMPVANRMVLAPTADREAADPTIMPGAAQAAALLGAIGVSSTVLRPAGTVQFGDEFVDVVSDGGFIPAGTRVQVVEVEGTRIVVKEV